MKQKNRVGEISFISKVAYGMGDVGNNFSWMFVGNFLMIFYTDVFGISMSAVATLMLVTCIWDAVNDPIIGSLADKTRSKWGRYRPWLLIGAPITGIVLIFTFWAHPEWSPTGKIVYMYITYAILVTGYSSVNIPYGTLCGAMTQNMDERSQINTSRSVSAMISIGIVNIITVPLIDKLGYGSEQRGYLTVAVLYAVIFMSSHLITFSKTKETITAIKKQKNPFIKQLKLVIKNKPYLLAMTGQILFGFVLYGRNANMLYYFKYAEGDTGLFSFFSIAIILPSVIGALCFPFVFKLTSNKGWAASVFSLGTGIMMFALYFFSPNTSPTPFYTFAALSQFFFSGFNTAIYAVIPDCVEYGEWKTGIRNDGFQYAFISFGNKIGMALGTSMLAIVLGMAGYQSNVAQNDTVLSIMQHAFSTVLGLIWILTAVVLCYYKLNKTSYSSIIDIIQYRNTER